MISRSFEKVEIVFLKLSQLSILAMMVLTAADAASRYIFDKPIMGAYEITERYLMIILVFLSMSYVQKVDGHIRLDILFEKFSQKLQDVLNIFFFLLAALLMAFIGYEGAMSTYNAIANNLQLSGLINFPLWLSYIWIPLGSFLITIRLLISIVRLAANLNKTKDVDKEVSR